MLIFLVDDLKPRNASNHSDGGTYLHFSVQVIYIVYVRYTTIGITNSLRFLHEFEPDCKTNSRKFFCNDTNLLAGGSPLNEFKEMFFHVQSCRLLDCMVDLGQQFSLQIGEGGSWQTLHSVQDGMRRYISADCSSKAMNLRDSFDSRSWLRLECERLRLCLISTPLLARQSLSAVRY